MFWLLRNTYVFLSIAFVLHQCFFYMGFAICVLACISLSLLRKRIWKCPKEFSLWSFFESKPQMTCMLLCLRDQITSPFSRLWQWEGQSVTSSNVRKDVQMLCITCLLECIKHAFETISQWMKLFATTKFYSSHLLININSRL